MDTKFEVHLIVNNDDSITWLKTVEDELVTVCLMFCPSQVACIQCMAVHYFLLLCSSVSQPVYGVLGSLVYFSQGNNITTTVGMRLSARSKGMGDTKFKARRVLLSNFAELVFKKSLMFQHLCFLFFQRSTHFLFNFTQYGQQLVIIGMTIFITNITQSCQH